MPHLTAPPYHTTPHCRRMVLLRLQNIGRGLWGSDGKCKRLMGYPPTLELWRSKLTRGGRIIFEVAADFSEEQHQVRGSGVTGLPACVSRQWMPLPPAIPTDGRRLRRAAAPGSGPGSQRRGGCFGGPHRFGVPSSCPTTKWLMPSPLLPPCSGATC